MSHGAAAGARRGLSTARAQTGKLPAPPQPRAAGEHDMMYTGQRLKLTGRRPPALKVIVAAVSVVRSHAVVSPRDCSRWEAAASIWLFACLSARMPRGLCRWLTP